MARFALGSPTWLDGERRDSVSLDGSTEFDLPAKPSMLTMSSEISILDLIEERFSSLSPRLRSAARFVLDHPEEIALHSMRSAAAKANIHPSSMQRLARELGFEGYESFRERFRKHVIAGGPETWTLRAQTLRGRTSDLTRVGLIEDLIANEQRNLDKTFRPEVHDSLVEACKLIDRARTAYVLGLRSLFPIAFYMHYVCRFFTTKTVLLTGLGGTFADDLRNVGTEDVLIAFSHRPYAAQTVTAVNFTRSRGVPVVAVTDSRVSPIVGEPGVSIIVSNASPSLFPTSLPALAVAQTLVALLVAESGEEAMAKIARTEEQLDSFGIYRR
ncbi:MAG: MurR/RpiR family transcriptional regulator [Hyphomicrobiales bacterium]